MKGPESTHRCHVLFVPRRTIECDEILNDSGLFQDATKTSITSIGLDLVALDSDLLSLEEPDNFMHHLLEDDDDYRVYVQNSLRRLESIYGKI